MATTWCAACAPRAWRTSATHPGLRDAAAALRQGALTSYVVPSRRARTASTTASTHRARRPTRNAKKVWLRFSDTMNGLLRGRGEKVMVNSTTTVDPQVATYLAGVAAALDDLRRGDREELLEEVEEHLADLAEESAARR